jgi:hypothetical protein
MNKLIISLFFLTLLFSCDKDNDTDISNNIPTNYVLYDGVYYDIGGPCLIEDFGEFDNDLYNLDIIIGSPNFYIDDDGEFEQFDTLANDHELYFELFSPETMLNSGLYTFNNTENPMTFDVGEFVAFNYDSDEFVFANFNSGTISLNINTESTSITLDIEGTTFQNLEITAHWEGDYFYSNISEVSNLEQEFKKEDRYSL